MTNLVRLTAAGQVSLPIEMRKMLNLTPGDFLVIEVTDDGHLLLKPHVLVPKDEAFFHRVDWQEAEREADADIAAGRVSGSFSDVDALMDDLSNPKV